MSNPISGFIGPALSFIAIPGVGAASGVLAAKVVLKYGHTFTQLSTKTFFLIGAVGAIHNFSAHLVRITANFKRNDKFPGRVFSHLITGGLVLGLGSYIALRRGSFEAAKSILLGTPVMVVADFIGSLMVEKGARWLFNKLNGK